MKKNFLFSVLCLLLISLSFNVNAQINNRVNNVPVGGGSCALYDVELIVTDVTWNVNGYHHINIDFNRPIEFNTDNTSQPYTCNISTTLYGVDDLPVKFFYETSPNTKVQAIYNGSGELSGFRVFPYNLNVTGVSTTANVMGTVGFLYDGHSTCVGVKSSNRAGYNCSLPNRAYYYCGGTIGVDIPIDTRLAQTTGQEIHTYPNPAQDRLFVETSTLDVKQINVMNLHGQILNDKVAIRYGIDRAQINTNQLDTGIYLIAIETPNGIIVEKVMIQ